MAPGRPYAIGLRLGERAARELAAPGERVKFQRWLERHAMQVAFVIVALLAAALLRNGIAGLTG